VGSAVARVHSIKATFAPLHPRRSCSACADLSRALGGDFVVGVASDFARERLVINLLVAGRKFSALALKGMLARVI
jgi:hypothetical protein